MKRRRAAVEDLLNEGGDGGTGGPVLGEGVNLLLGGNLTSEEKPEETLRKRLRPARGLRESLLDLGDGLAAETDTLLYRTTGELYCIATNYPTTYQRRGQNHPR